MMYLLSGDAIVFIIYLWERNVNSERHQKFLEIIKAQGGDLSGLRVSKNTQDIVSTRNGHIVDMNAYNFGKLSLDLGGGRITKEDKIDPGVGVVLKKKIGDDVKIGDVLCTLYLKKGSRPVLLDVGDYYTFAQSTRKEEPKVESL